jgi:hypothetical protein
MTAAAAQDFPDLREALALAQSELDVARAAQNRTAEAYRAGEIADLFYRIGDARAAFDAFVLAMQLGAGDDGPDEDLALEVAAAQAARRAGLVDEALAGMSRALESPLAKTPATRAALLAEHAWALAAAGQDVEARSRIAEADELARASDDADAVTRVHRVTAEIALAVGRAEAAANAFALALEVAQSAGSGEAEDDPDDSPVAPSEVFSVLAGIHAAGGAADEILLGAIALAPEALREGDAWWELHRIVPGLLRIATIGYLDEPALALPARVVAAAALQREECSEHHAALRTLLR